jgi:hypothetical protein
MDHEEDYDVDVECDGSGQLHIPHPLLGCASFDDPHAYCQEGDCPGCGMCDPQEDD